MNLLLVIPWEDDSGGLGAVLTHVSKYLASHGHRVTFLFPGESNVPVEKPTRYGFPGVQLNLRPPFNRHHPVRSLLAFLIFLPFTLCHLVSLLRACRIQVINIHYPLDSFIYFALCRRILRIALVTSLHGGDVFPDGARRRRPSLALRCLLHASDLIVMPSQGFLREIARLFPTLSGKLSYIYNGIDHAELSQKIRAPAAAGLGRYVLCVAAHNERKGVDVLIRSFAKVRNEHPELKLVLLGDGPARPRLEALTWEMGLRDSVVFLGIRPRTDVIGLLRHCEVFVLPSRSESFGIAVLEAMACGRAVVACAVGGIPDIITDCANGLLVPPNEPSALANALLRVLGDRALRASMGENAFATVQGRFRWEDTGANYEGTFVRLGEAASA